MYRNAALLLQEKTHITTLSNGLRIASEASSLLHQKDLNVASVVLRVACSYLHETPMTSGASSIAARVITRCGPDSRILRESGITDMGIGASDLEATYNCAVGKKPNILRMVELLIKSVRNQMFLESDVREQIEMVKAEVNPSSPFLSKFLHQAAYQGAYANPDYPLAAFPGCLKSKVVYSNPDYPPLALAEFPGCLNSKVVKDFVTEHYIAPRMTLWVYGAEHDDVLSVAKPLLLDLPGSPVPPEPKAVYTGGDFRCIVENESEPITQVVLAFEIPVVWHKMKGYRSDATLNILEELLGGMGGITDCDTQMEGSKLPNYSRSRLCVRILNKYPQVHHVSALSFIHHDTGLFGIQVYTDKDFVSKAIDLVANEFLEIATPGKVSQAELDCAKQSMESSVLKGLEADMITQSLKIVDDLSRFGERVTVEHKLKAMDEVTLTDIESLAGKLLSSPLTMLSIGKVENVPSYDSVSRKFHAK